MYRQKPKQTFAPGYARQKQIIDDEKAKAKTLTGKRGYFAQAVDYGEDAPKSKEEIEFFKTQKTFRENYYKPALNNLKDGSWKSKGISSNVENEINKAAQAGYISYEEKQQYTSLASEKLRAARKTTIISGGSTPTSGSQHLNGRDFNLNILEVQNARTNKRKSIKSALLREQTKLPLLAQETNAMISAGAGTLAGTGLGAVKSALNVGRSLTDSELVSDLYNYLDDGEKKYQSGVDGGANQNLFLETMYGAAGETEKLAVMPAIAGGELGRITLGRGVGMLTGMTYKQQDDAYANLGIGDWYAEKTGDPDNLLRQASALSAGIALGTLPGAGLDLLTMKMAGTAFVAATRPIVKTMVQSQIARTVGSLAPGATSAIGTSGLPGQVAKVFGANQQQAEFANKAVDIAGRPLSAAVEAMPVNLQTSEGSVINTRQMNQDRAAQLDPNGIASTGATLGLFGSGAFSFYKDAKRLFQVNRLLAKANATQYQGRFLNAGDRLLREKTGLLGSVGPDAAFGVNNMFTPIAQSYRAATDKSVDASGELLYKQPTMSDIGRAALMSLIAVRPHAKLSGFITPALRGKVMGQGSDIKTEARLMANDWVDSGEWRSQGIQRRFKQLTGREANTDDVKRVVSAAYDMIAEPARQAIISGEVLPTHAAELFFHKLITGQAAGDQTSLEMQRSFNKLVTSMRVKGDTSALTDSNPLLSQKINENIFVLNPKDRSRAIAEIAPYFEQQMLKSLKPAPITTDTAAKKPDSTVQTKRQSSQQFFAIRIEDTEDGVPQYIAFNPHKGPDGYTFRSVEIVRGDEDVTDLIMLDQPVVNRKNRFYTTEQIVRAVSTRFDIFSPFNSHNKWTVGGKTKTIGGFNTDGTIIVKSNSGNGRVETERVGSIELIKSLSKSNVRLLDQLRPILSLLNTNNSTDNMDLLDYTDGVDFTDKVAFTSDDGQVKFVNGRLVSTSGGPNPIGLYQLVDGTIYIQPLAGDQLSTTTKPILTARQVDESPDTINGRTIYDAQDAVDSQLGYIRMDIHNTGMPTRVPVGFEVLDLIDSVLKSNDSLQDKSETIRSIVAEDYALNIAGERFGLRSDLETGEIVNDANILAGDIVSGQFTNDSDLQKAIVIKSDNNLVTVRLLSDPVGDAYTVPVDTVILNTQQNKTELLERTNNFVPTESRPVHRPWTRTHSDEEEFNTYIALKTSSLQKQRILNATQEELPNILLDVIKSGNAFNGDVKRGLISWAASNGNVEIVLDSIIGVFNDAIKPGAVTYDYLTRVSNLYGDNAFLDQLYYLDGLASVSKSGALLSAQSIQGKSTATAIARRMNLLAYRSRTRMSPESAYEKSIKSLNIVGNAATKRDAIEFARLLRGIAPHAAYHVDNIWQMRVMSGSSPEMQVFLGRAIAVANDPNSFGLFRQLELPFELTRFWTSERMYRVAVKTVQNAIRTSNLLDVKQQLSDIGLEFLYYAAIEKRSKLLLDEINNDTEKYKEWQRKLNTYVTNNAIPTIVLRSIENDIASGDFMGYVNENIVHQTNQVSFIDVLAKFGDDITKSVANSDHLNNEKKSTLLVALNDLLGQIQDMSPEMRGRISNYTPSNITANVEYTLLTDGTANNLSLVDYQHTVDRAVQSIIDQALTDDITNQLREDIESGEKSIEDLDIESLARRSSYEKLRSDMSTIQFTNALSHFKFNNIEDFIKHIALHEEQFDIIELRRDYKKALIEQNYTVANQLKSNLNNAKQKAFQSAFKTFVKSLEVATQISTVYADVLGSEVDNLITIIDALQTSYNSYFNDYMQEQSQTGFELTGGSDIEGTNYGAGRIVATTSDDGTTTTDMTSASNDLTDKEMDERKFNIKTAKSKELESAKRKGATPEELEAITSFYDNDIKKLLEQDNLITATNTKSAFLNDLQVFNNYITNKLPELLSLSSNTNLGEKMALLVNLSTDMLQLISKDIFTGSKKIIEIKNNVLSQVATKYDRTRSIGSDVQTLRRASTNIEITEDATGTITLNNLTISAIKSRPPISNDSRAIDALNADALDNEIVLSESDLMFNQNDIESQIVDLINEDPLIDIVTLTGDLKDNEAFDGMVSSSMPTEQRVKLYSLHARNFNGMRELLEGLLLKTFDFKSTDEALDNLGDSTDNQRRYASTTSISPERSGLIGDQILLDNGDLVKTANTIWTSRIRAAIKTMQRDLNTSGATKRYLDEVSDALVNILKNANAYNNVHLLAEDISEQFSFLINQKLLKLDKDVKDQIIIAFTTDSILDMFSTIDKLGNSYSHKDGYMDVPYQIKTTINALEKPLNPDMAVEFSHVELNNVANILSMPTSEGLSRMTPATAEHMIKLYNTLNLDRYNQNEKDQINKIKLLYTDRAQFSERTQEINRDLSFIKSAKSLANGLARAYDNFAYGYGKNQYSLFINSSLPEHRTEIINAMRIVGVQPEIIDYFKRTPGSFESLIASLSNADGNTLGQSARLLLNPEQQNAIATYVIAKGRANYYLNSGKLMITSSDLMEQTNANMVTHRDGKLVHGAFLSTQRLMMLSSDANGPRTADTIFHEITHALFTALDDVTQVRFLESILPNIDDISDANLKGNPLYPALLQLKAIDIFKKANPNIRDARLYDIWKSEAVVDYWKQQGMSDDRIDVMQMDWYGSAHELFAVALQNFIVDIGEPASSNASTAIDTDAAAIFQQISGPIRSMWHQLARANQPDIIMTNGRPHKAWASYVPTGEYNTGYGRNISYPQVRQGDFLRIQIPNKTRLTTDSHNIFGVPDLLNMWITGGATSDSVHHKFGYQTKVTMTVSGQTQTRDTNVAIDNETALSHIANMVVNGQRIGFFVNPIGKSQATELNDNKTAWGQFYNGRIVDQVMLKQSGTDDQQTVFAYAIGGKTFSFSSMKDNDGVYESGFYKTRVDKTSAYDEEVPAPFNRIPSTSKYTTIPNVDTYFVIETPIELSVYDADNSKQIKSFTTNARYLVSSKSLLDSTYNPQLLGYSGDFNPKFSAVLYDVNRKIDNITRAVSNYHSYSDQLKLERQLLTGTVEDFRTDFRQGVSAADRIADYWSSQGKDVRAAGVDLYGPMATGRSQFENVVLGLMRQRKLIDLQGNYTEDGAAFIDQLNNFSVNPLGEYINRNRLFRNSLRDFRAGVINSDESAFTIAVGSPQYESIRTFKDKIDRAINELAVIQGISNEDRTEFIEAKQNELFTAIYNQINPRLVTTSDLKTNKKPLQDRILTAIEVFNEQLPDSLHITTDSLVDTNVIDVVPILQTVLQSTGIGTSDSFIGIRAINDLLTSISTNQNIDMPIKSYQTNSSGYVMNRAIDVIFGRDNVVGKWEFLQRLTSVSSDERSKAMQLLIATSHILDLQERQINTAKYKWNAYKLSTSSFIDNGAVRITDESGRIMKVDFTRNEVFNIGIDHLNANRPFKSNIYSSQFPLFNSDTDVNFTKMAKSEVDELGQSNLVKSMTKMEQEQYHISQKGIVVMRDYDITDPSQPQGIYLYRVNKLGRKAFTETGVGYSVDRLSNPYVSFYQSSGDGPQGINYVNNQRVMQQSPSKLMFLAMQRYFDTTNPENYKTIERIRKTSIVPAEVYIAKMLVARAQRLQSSSIPTKWRDGMRDNYVVKKAIANIGDDTYEVLQSAIVNNKRSGTWLSSGDIVDESAKPFSDYENDLLRGLPDLPAELANDEMFVEQWKQQRYEMIQERMAHTGDPENIIFERHGNNDQIGVAIDGRNVHITIPDSGFKETIGAMFSSSPTEIATLSDIPVGSGTTMPANTIPKDYPIWRLIGTAFLNLSSLEVVKRLSRDFARPMIQNYALTAFRPKDMAMQFYGILGMMPNLWWPSGTNRSGNIYQKLFTHQKDVALGDMMYHKIIDGIFRKYGKKNSVINIGVPFLKSFEAVVVGKYNRESGRRESYTIEDLNEYGLATSYGEWYAAASAAQALNPLLQLKDVPIQLTGAENIGQGIVPQRIVPFVGMTERGGLLSTDLLRIKQFLEIARVVDRRPFDHLDSKAWFKNADIYEADKVKQNFARIINTLSGSPVGEDPNTHPIARDIGYLAGNAYTAPNWGKSLKAASFLPMMAELAAAHAINYVFRPVYRKFNQGAEFNTINLGAYHNYLRAISQFTSAGKTTAKTPAIYNLSRISASIGQTMFLWYLLQAGQINIQERAFLAAQGKPTEWYELNRTAELMDEANVKFEGQDFFDFNSPTKFGKVISFGNMQLHAPPIVMGMHRFIGAPYYRAQQLISNGVHPVKAIGETMLNSELLTRINPMYMGVWNAIKTGRTFSKAALFQQHPGFTYFLQHKNDLLRTAGPYSLDLLRLAHMYPNGASRFALDQEVLPVQKLFTDLENMLYQKDAQYNHATSTAMRYVGMENSYYNTLNQDVIPAMKSDGFTIGSMVQNVKEYGYDYPNAFDMVSQFGLKSLYEGIPGSGDIGEDGWSSTQVPRMAGVPTQAVIDVSKQQSERQQNEMRKSKETVILKNPTQEQMNNQRNR